MFTLEFRLISLLRVLGILELLGGAIGLFLVGKALVAETRPSLAFLLLAVTFFAASIWAGWLLLRKGSSGLIPSMVIQMLQVPRIALYGFAFSFASGAHLSLEFKNGQMQFSGQLGSHATFGMVESETTLFVGINYLALAALVMLLRTERDSVVGATRSPVQSENTASTRGANSEVRDHT